VFVDYSFKHLRLTHTAAKSSLQATCVVVSRRLGWKKLSNYCQAIFQQYEMNFNNAASKFLWR